MAEQLRDPFRIDVDERTGAIETSAGVFTLHSTISEQWVETPSQQRYRWVNRFANARELRRGALIDTPGGQLSVASVRHSGRGRTIEISGNGICWRARRTGFMRAELVDDAGRVLAQLRRVRSIADGAVDEATLGLVLLLVFGGVLTMTSRFELTLQP
jgi:hypothetical protein